uniref:Response regulatory domain-containing protein n=1 Tax=Chenopodium quinoa TaxID=63459 RepID=A0A803KZ30_CHEQI
MAGGGQSTNASSSARLAKVVTAFQGADALELLKKKKRRVDLVLMPTELPDMCTLEVLDILKSKYNMAVVMLVDTDQPSAKEEFLWNGAMFCYKKPLDSMSAATLWQHAFVKEAELFNADPLEVLNRMHVPGLTLDEVTDKLQEYQARQNNPDYPPIPMRIIDLNAGNQLMGQNIYANPGQAFAHEQGILQNPRQDQLNRARAYEIPAPPLALVTSVPFVPHVPNMPQLPQASVPPANTAQMLIVPPWPPAPTYLPSSSVAPPAPGHGEDDGKLGG